MLAILPRDRREGPRVAADDGFEGQLNREIEVRGDERAAAFDDVATVGFERVGGVVEAVAEDVGRLQRAHQAEAAELGEAQRQRISHGRVHEPGNIAA